LTQTDEPEIKASWFDFAKRLHTVGMGICSASTIEITDQGGDHKKYEDSPTLDPKAVCNRAKNKSYIFYQQLSWDAHPTIETLNRYYDPPDGDGAPGIDVNPIVRDVEVIEMLNLICLAVIAVFLAVAELLEQDTTTTSKMAVEICSPSVLVRCRWANRRTGCYSGAGHAATALIRAAGRSTG
jgi:hypothetical protein